MGKEREDEILYKIIRRSVADQGYRLKLIKDPYGTIKEMDTSISKKEAKKIAKQAFNLIPGFSQDESLNIIKGTLNNAKKTFRTIVKMSVVLFSIGIILLVFAAISGLIRQGETYTLIFGGTGLADVFLFFIYNPIKRVQKSIGNLVQLEISYLSYYSQIFHWNKFVSDKDADFSMIDKVNTAIDKISTKALQNIENFVEEKITEQETK